MDEVFNILIVDDDEVDRMAVRRALKSAGVEVELSEVSDGVGAIAALSSETFDCVFLDYRLPDKDGLALIQEVRSSKNKVPLVVLTGQGDEQTAVDLMKAGASDYLAKSRVSPETLVRILHNAIRVHRAEMQVELASRRLRESNELLLRKNTELEQKRQQIHLQNLKLLEASRLKSEFLATISHELRTPLNAIIGFSQLLLRPAKGILTPQQQDMVERILNNGRNLLALLNEILDFSRIEAGRLTLKPEHFDLNQLVTTTVEELRSLAEQKQLTLQIDTDLTNSAAFNDPNRVRQVLTNLLSNAIKFTELGGIWVTVADRSGDRIRISVRDTGVGIDPIDLAQIFEPFRQLDQTTTRKHAGTGLGLAITASLLQMMQGDIKVDSELGKGSMFWVEFPRCLPASQSGDESDAPILTHHSPPSTKTQRFTQG